VSRGGDLLRLQEIDARLAHDRSRLRDVEASIAGDPELDSMRREARRRRRERSGADEELAAAEQEAEKLRRRGRELNRHLYDGSVRNPQELVGMQHDLEALRLRVDEQDDRVLALMETAEAAAAVVRDANAVVVERENARAESSGDLSEQAVAIRAAVEQHERERSELSAAMPPADRALYERLAARIQPAVARIVADSCGGCHMPFTVSEVRRIRLADAPAQCAECDRLVVA
jgi:predicted  nucleic acid-binding Zn-ribbon protein